MKTSGIDEGAGPNPVNKKSECGPPPKLILAKSLSVIALAKWEANAIESVFMDISIRGINIWNLD